MDSANADEKKQGDPFSTTHWSVVLTAGDSRAPESRQALAALYRKYWRPLYVYARRRGRATEEAQDLTQEFFTTLIEKNYLGQADPNRGRFRCFVLTAFKHFLANEWDKARAKKRGGWQTLLMLDFPGAENGADLEPSHSISPDKLYEQQWALSLLDEVLSRLRAEYARAGKEDQFEVLKVFFTGAKGSISYKEAAAKLGMSTGATKVAAHRLRRKYRQALREEIAQTVDHQADIDEELRHLFSSLSV